jgi:hypothetical protein
VITNDWNYDASWTLTSFPVWDFENFKRLDFVVQSVQSALTITNAAICKNGVRMILSVNGDYFQRALTS